VITIRLLGVPTIQRDDRYQWVHAHVLDTMISMALDRDSNEFAGALIRTLATLAVRCDMRELTVRAHLHRHRAGDRAALTAARLIAQDIDNLFWATSCGLSRGGGSCGTTHQAVNCTRAISLQKGANISRRMRLCSTSWS
jgi:hypothetical protein